MNRFSSILLLLSVMQGIVYATNNQVRGGIFANYFNTLNSDRNLRQGNLMGGMMVVRTAESAINSDHDKQFRVEPAKFHPKCNESL